MLHGGKVFSGDSSRPWVEAVAVRGERIAAVGSSRDMLALGGPATRVVDLAGKVVIPGFNDAHLHYSASAPMVWFATRSPDPTLAEVLDSISAGASRLPAGTWIGLGVAAAVFDDPEATRAPLDRVAPNHPVMLSGMAGNGRILNTNALRTLGIEETAADPFGGSYDRRDRSRVITGPAHGYAGFNATIALSRPPDSAAIADLRALARSAASYGITSIQQIGFPYDATRSIELLRMAAIPLRWPVTHFPTAPLRPADVARLKSEERHPLPNVTVSGIKWISDGTPLERRMFMREPYADRPGWRGEPYLDSTALGEAIRATLASGHQLLMHAASDPATFTRRFGAERLRRLSNLRSIVEPGIPVALGSDGPLIRSSASCWQ